MAAKNPNRRGTAEEVLIRAFDDGDAEDLLQVFQQPKCIYGTLQYPYRSPKEIREGFASLGRDGHRLVAVVREEGKARVVGTLTLVRAKDRRAHAASLGMLVHDDYQGMGIGTRLLEEAVGLARGWLQISRIELTVFTDNAQAIRMYEKAGFRKEGTMRRYAWRNGEFADVYAMAWLRDG